MAIAVIKPNKVEGSQTYERIAARVNAAEKPGFVSHVIIIAVSTGSHCFNYKMKNSAYGNVT